MSCFFQKKVKFYKVKSSSLVMAGDTTDGCLPSKIVPSESSQEMESVSQSQPESDHHQHSVCSQSPGVSHKLFLLPSQRSRGDLLLVTASRFYLMALNCSGRGVAKFYILNPKRDHISPKSK